MSLDVNGFSTKELIGKVWDIVDNLDQKVDKVIDDHNKRISTLEGQFNVYQSDRKWALGIVALMVAAMIATITTTLQGCSVPQPTDDTVAMLTPVPVSTPTMIPSPTCTQTPQPQEPETEQPTVEEFPFYTPTPITPTAPIIEVTPIGGQTSNWQILPSGTTFVVTASILKVRKCPSTDCELLDRYGTGKEVDVIARLQTKTSTDQWMCLIDLVTIDNVVTCRKAIAYIYNDQQLGKIVWPEVY